ncbi:MAG: hypothetical protein GXP10_03865, partial [Gammaproteobacteria bacterium]|nr:hypothetical protein [Gammaproteobacteria bacterium]
MDCKKKGLAQRTFWWCCHGTWHTVVTMLVLIAIVISVGRLMLPEVGQYRADIEQLLGDVLERPIRIGAVDAQWTGLKPRLRLQRVSVLDSSSGQTLLHFTEVRASLDLLSSLLQLRPVLGDMTAVVDNLTIERRASGEITFAGFSGSAPDSELERAKITRQALQWLLSMERIDVDLSRLIWRDRQLNNKPLVFDSLRLQLRNGDQRHQLNAAILLPSHIGEGLTIAFDMKGDIEEAWSATLYVEGKGIQLTQWMRDQGLNTVRLHGGHADLRSWSEWQNGTLQSVTGELSASHVKLLRSAARQTKVAAPLDIHALFGQFIWQRETQGWRLDVDRFVLNLGGRTWPASRLAIAYHEAEQTRTFTAQSDFLRLEDIDALISACSALPDELQEALQNLQPRGDLRQSYAQVSTPEGQPSSYLIATRGEDLAIRPWRSVPGISGVDGLVTLNETRGAIDLHTTGLRYDSRGIFREPLMMDHVNGRLTWQRSSDGLHIVGDALRLNNSDIEVTAALQLDIPGSGQAPFMRLRADYKNGNAASASRYFPVVIMHPEFVDWLDDAIVAGRIPSGYAHVEGRLGKALFFDDPQASKQQKSHFEIGFHVKDAIFDYLPDWPRIEGAEADVLFKGRSMKIKVTDGKLLGSRINEAQIAIEDMAVKPVVMSVDGQVVAAADEMLRYVAQSPLKPVLQEFSDVVDVSGTAKLDLHLDLPLSDACCGFDGTLHFNDNQLSIADGAVQLDHLQGSLRFNNDGITSPLIRGRIMGAGARFSIASINDAARKFIRIDASGDVSDERLGDLLNISSSNPFSGETSWDARLDIGDSSHRSHLSIESRLTGMAVDLPYPLT